jgi:hypothetical protein
MIHDRTASAMNTSPPSRPRREPAQAAGFRSARQFPWTKEEDALLGKFTPRKAAGPLNRTLGGARDRQKFLGKPAIGHAPPVFRIEREPRDHYTRLFATKSNREPCTILGRSYKRIRTRRRQLAGGRVKRLRPEWRWEGYRPLVTAQR